MSVSLNQFQDLPPPLAQGCQVFEDSFQMSVQCFLVSDPFGFGEEEQIVGTTIFILCLSSLSLLPSSLLCSL